MAIEKGELKPGDQVDSENQLAVQSGVSRMTARRALTELVDEGILARSQGLGTFVADSRPMSSMLSIVSIHEEIRTRGHDYRSDVLALHAVSADNQTGRWLGVEPGTEVFFSRVIHYENQLPVQVENRWVNPRWAPDYLHQQLDKTTANEYLSQVAPLTEADHTVEAVLPDAQQAGWLQIAPGQPCLLVRRRTFSARGIVSYAELTHPGNRYRLGGHLAFNAPLKETRK